MAEESSDEPVHVTGEERQHPAYRLLARAMLALVRLRKDRDVPANPPAENDETQEEAGNG